MSTQEAALAASRVQDAVAAMHMVAPAASDIEIIHACIDVISDVIMKQPRELRGDFRAAVIEGINERAKQDDEEFLPVYAA